MNRLCLGFLVCFMGGCSSSAPRVEEPAPQPVVASAPDSMSLGNFSVSLSVKDLAASRAFYEKLGFHAIAGQPERNWIILQNDTATIGLFQGMLDKNTLTFNPGWDRDAKALPAFEDVRDLQKTLMQRGVIMALATDESASGPAFIMTMDPDGNPVLIDQHIDKPRQ